MTDDELAKIEADLEGSARCDHVLTCHDLIDEVRRLQSENQRFAATLKATGHEIERLNAQLHRLDSYARHLEWCKALLPLDTRLPCSCGLDAVAPPRAKSDA